MKKQSTDESVVTPVTTEKPAATAGRRALVNSSALGVAATALAWVAVACGGDDDDDDGTSSGGSSGKNGSGGSAGRGGSGGTSGSGGVAGAPLGGAGGEAGAELDADVAPLNALLTAEYRAITAYSAGAALIGGAENDDPLKALAPVIGAVATDFRAHHVLHAAALVAEIEKLGGEPVSQSEVARGFEAPQGLVDNPTILNVLKLGASAERAAAVAYNQVLAGLEDAKLRFLATSIEGDESQHFIILAALVLGLAGPGENLDTDTAGDVVPQPFVTTVDGGEGLDVAPPDYFP